MRTLAVAVSLGVVISLTPASLDAQPTSGPKIRVAVMEPEWDPGVVQSAFASGRNSPDAFVSERQTFARGMSEMMISELLEADRFVVVERQALADVLAEQDLQYSGAVNTETAVEAGRLIGAQYLIRPAITEFSYGEEGGTKGGAVEVPVDVPIAGRVKVGGGKSKIVAKLVVDSRIYEVETGQIVASLKSEATADRNMSNFSLNTEVFDYGSAGFDQTPLGAATREAVADAVKQIVGEIGDEPWQGRVVTVRGGQIYINAGSESGVQVGDVMEVYRGGEELIDPDTGLKLGQVEKLLGRIKVTNADEKFAIASPVGSFSCERNDIVRYVGN